MSNNPFSITAADHGALDSASAASGASVLPVGINENIALSEVTLHTEGEEASLSFTLSDKSGRAVTHRVFGPGKPRPKDGETPQEAYLRIAELKRRWIFHFCSALMPKDRIIVQANNWNDFCRGVYALVHPAFVAPQSFGYRVLLEYNYRGYVSLPDYAPFIQPMSSEEKMDYEGRQLRLLRPEKGGGRSGSPAMTTAADADSAADDLPF